MPNEHSNVWNDILLMYNTIEEMKISIFSTVHSVLHKKKFEISNDKLILNVNGPKIHGKYFQVLKLLVSQAGSV